MTDHVDDEVAAEAARELIDDIEAELLKAGIPIETLETLRFAYATQDKLDAPHQGRDRAATASADEAAADLRGRTA